MERRTQIVFALLLPAICAAPVAAAPSTRYTITDLGTLGGTYARASGINGTGVVVGLSSTNRKTRVLTSYQYETHAFSWTAGRMRDLGTLGGGWSEAHAINDRGEIVGSSETDRFDPAAFRHLRAFLYSHGKMRDLGTLSGDVWSIATAINAQGKIVGIVGTEHTTQEGVTVQQAVIWSGGKIRALDNPPSEAYGINRYDHVVGKSLSGVFSPAEWSPGSKPVVGLATTGWGYALAINAHGQTVGEDYGGGFGKPRQAFLSDLSGTARDLPPLGGQKAGVAKAINNLGAAVGVSGEACVWEGGTVTDLNDFLPPGSGWILTDATGINDRGQICGNGTFHGRERAFLLTPLLDR